MQCPICKVDLSPLDLTSRTEHVDLCIDNGPSTLDINEEGRLVVKKTIDPKKQRKICPICDKTFTNLNPHFKTCSIKNDVPPDLMLDYWDKINSDSTNPKKFPRELLDNFVAKCVKEGRVGEQVDFARALSLSMANGEPSTSLDSENSNLENKLNSAPIVQNSSSITTNQEFNITQQHKTNINNPIDATHILIQNSSKTTSNGINSKSKTKKQYKLELADDLQKRANVDLRIDRELAASRTKRYYEAIRFNKNNDPFVQDDNCDENQDDVIIIQESQPLKKNPIIDIDADDLDLNKLFYKSRMKNCLATIDCSKSECIDHDLVLSLDDFKIYSGASMDATPKKRTNENISEGIIYPTSSNNLE